MENGGCVGISDPPNPFRTLMKTLLRRIFSRENLYALFLCLIVILIIIMTVEQAPQWIYQGF